MIKLSASLSRKTPLPGVEFSSQQYHAGLEVEISDADSPEAIKSRIHDLYGQLNQCIDEQIAGIAHPGRSSAPAPVNRLPRSAPVAAASAGKSPAKPTGNNGGSDYIEPRPL